MFVSPDGITQSQSLQNMILAQRKRFASAYSGSRHTGRFDQWLSIFVDKSGNIWLKDSRNLHVLVGDRWLDGGEAIKKAGAARPEVEYLAGVGDGSRVYLNDFNFKPEQKAAFFGEVKNGELHFTQAPHTCERTIFQTIVDRTGALWIPDVIGTCSSYSGKTSLRLTEKGVAEELQNKGWPYLVDEGGNLWLGDIWLQRPNRFNIYRQGMPPAALTIPSADKNTRLFSDKPHSVWAFTPIGLQHFVATADNPTTFVRKGVYSITGLKGFVQRVEYSPLGYVVVGTFSEKREYHLSLIRLPKE
jgi:hypothetical protein